MMCVPSPPIYGYCFSLFGDMSPRFSHLLLETAMIEFSMMSFVCFVQAMLYGVADFFMPARLRALTAAGRLCTNEEVLVPLSRKMRAIVLKRGLLRRIIDCAVDLVSAILPFVPAGVVDWADPDCVEWFLHGSTDVSFISFLEWQAKSLEWGLRGHTLPKVVPAEVVPRNVEAFCSAGMSREFAKVVWDYYKKDGTDLR